MTEESLFAAALTRATASERRAYLEGACAGDDALRERVERLLAANDKILGILDQSARPLGWTEFAAGPGLANVSVSLHAGAVIAERYKLLEEIGIGGMGTVWKAEQTQPVRRVVALKLIKAGMDSRTVLARFEAERQALALMEHPNIARVLDGGKTDDGRPFFVMEYVQGVPFTHYCDEARLSIAERLALFVPVCQAVQHAHTKGVIHRDLKPTNILVCLYDGQPVPKVIDFGLAKAILEPLTERTLHTAHGAVLGTPLYMSPEQAEINNLDVDARADVYALGVILYELLTGTTPLERGRFHEAAWHEMLRVIREEDPPRPSARLSSSDSLPSLAAERRMEPIRLTRLVRGELDWIAMKCLEKDRSRRYETASGLARDVGRYLSDESVEACPPSAGYRLGKFLRRNRGPMIAAAIFFVLLVGGMVGTFWGMVRADRAWKDEAKANAQAQKRLRQIEKGSEILATVFTDLNPHDEEKEARPLLAILGDRLVQAAEQLEGEEVGDPLVVATLQSRLGRSLIALGMAQQAIPILEKARATRTAIQGADHTDALGSSYELGNCLLIARDERRGLPLMEETLGRMKARIGPDHPLTLKCMNSLAGGYHDAGKQRMGLELYQETLPLRIARLGTDDPETLQTMDHLAVSYTANGRPDQALPLLEETLRLRKLKLGPTHVDTILSMRHLGLGYREDGKVGRAVSLLEETLGRMQAKLSLDHPYTIGCMNDLAITYRLDRTPEKALPLLESALEISRAKRGVDHPDTLTLMNNLATAYRNNQKLDKALGLYEEALRLQKSRLPPGHPSTLSTMNNLGTVYQLAGKLEQALPLLKEALEIMSSTQGADHPKTIVSMINLAECYRSHDELDRALPLLEGALRLIRSKPAADFPLTLNALYNLATAYRDAGDLDRALPLAREAATILEAREFEHRVASRILDNLTDLLERTKRFDEAESWHRKWLAVVKQKSGDDSSAYAGELEALGANLLRQKQWSEAELVLREALALFEKKSPDSSARFHAESLLGGALLGQKKYAEAEPMLLHGYEGTKDRVEKLAPTERHRVAESGEQIIRLYEGWGRAEKAVEWRSKLAGSGAAETKP